MSKHVIQCWNCGTRLNLDERNENDGDCMECGVELALDDYLVQAANENAKLRSELAALKEGQGEAVGRVFAMADGQQYASLYSSQGQHLVGSNIYIAPPATGVIDPGWRCYHCDEHFTDAESAGLHFGTHQHQKPACLIDIAEYRAMEARMHSYNEEDAEIHRAMARMHGEHRTALQREEDKGYARALKDTGYDASADAVSVVLFKTLSDAVSELSSLNSYAREVANEDDDEESQEVCDSTDESIEHMQAVLNKYRALLAQSQGLKP